jgi:HD-like signal output (HDOD) protein
MKELMADPTARSAALNEAMQKIASHPDYIARILNAVKKGNTKLMNVEQVMIILFFFL